MSHSKPVPSALVQGLGGAGGALLATIATYPLLTLSTLQATRRSDGKVSRDDFLKQVSQLIREEGVGVFFRGVGPTLLGTIVSQGLYFYLYAYLKMTVLALKNKKDKVKKVVADLSVVEASIVAFLAGCGNVLITNPIWVVATRMITAKKQSASGNGLVRVVTDIYQDYGVLGYWKGVLPSLVMVSNPVIQYSLFEFLCAEWRKTKLVNQQYKLLPSEIFFLSGFAKLGSTIVTYPMLLVKQRLQAARKQDTSMTQYSGSADAILKILKQEGFGGFFKGMKAKMMQSVLTAAIMFTTKEQLTDLLQQIIVKQQQTLLYQ
eukprot:TRINITY_DN10928_c0_g2_i1.p1 TRINITY_DN10928_c0_g2~~TRINITY_DN10928_c0_g2_i1.p1  ORF type:complete len:319 (-),score=26.44 TRINITY_DN10928_c0_g2_i1:217-1173(-)